VVRSIFGEHHLKGRLADDDSARMTMLLPVHRNDGLMYAYTAAIGGYYENSFVGVGAGTPMYRLDNRKALVNVTAINTVIPEGRIVAPDESIVGLMEPELNLIGTIREASDDRAYEIVKNILDDLVDDPVIDEGIKGQGRFTSVAIALLFNPQKADKILARLTNRERLASTCSYKLNSDVEYRTAIQIKMMQLEPILRAQIQLATKDRILPATEVGPSIKRGMLMIDHDLMRLAKEAKAKGESSFPERWEKEETWKHLSEWDNVFEKFTEHKDEVTVWLNARNLGIMKYSFNILNYSRAMAPTMRGVVDRYIITKIYNLAVWWGVVHIYVQGPRVLFEHIEAAFKAGARKYYERPDFRNQYDAHFDVTFVEDPQKHPALKDTARIIDFTDTGKRGVERIVVFGRVVAEKAGRIVVNSAKKILNKYMRVKHHPRIILVKDEATIEFGQAIGAAYFAARNSLMIVEKIKESLKENTLENDLQDSVKKEASKDILKSIIQKLLLNKLENPAKGYLENLERGIKDYEAKGEVEKAELDKFIKRAFGFLKWAVSEAITHKDESVEIKGDVLKKGAWVASDWGASDDKMVLLQDDKMIYNKKNSWRPEIFT
jgi:hypothetical protein